jgi:hypothetical protein
MGLLDGVKDLLAQYASGTASSGDAAQHFDQVTQSVDQGTLAQGVTAAIRSDQTPPFAQIASQLFASGSADQKLAMLNTLVSSISPEQRAQLSQLIPGLASGAPITPGQAAAVPPDAVQTIARHAETHNPNIVERMSDVYAAHPTLVKTLGSAAMMIAMRTIAQRHV